MDTDTFWQDAYVIITYNTSSVVVRILARIHFGLLWADIALEFCNNFTAIAETKQSKMVDAE